MSALGVGAGFIRWVKLLLTSTGECALVNGYVSGKYEYTAGVRQGSPLSLQLYYISVHCSGHAVFSQSTGFGGKSVRSQGYSRAIC